MAKSTCSTSSNSSYSSVRSSASSTNSSIKSPASSVSSVSSQLGFKPVTDRRKRLAANARERKRMHLLNQAYDRLRKRLHDAENKSKYDVLVQAKEYIRALVEMVEELDGGKKMTTQLPMSSSSIDTTHTITADIPASITPDDDNSRQIISPNTNNTTATNTTTTIITTPPIINHNEHQQFTTIHHHQYNSSPLHPHHYQQTHHIARYDQANLDYV